jgi:hypothetical protein
MLHFIQSGIGAKGMKLYHEKVIHEQNIILQSWPSNPKMEGTLEPGVHRWPFQFLLSNRLVETIEDERAKVYYYVTASVQRVGMSVTRLRCRRDILLLRTPSWSDSALTANSLPTTSIVSERKLDVCDARICTEKSHVSSGTQFPISLHLFPNRKNVFLESINVILTEKRTYRLPEFQARRSEHHDFKVTLVSVSSLIDPGFTEPSGLLEQLSIKEMRRALGIKNAHIPLDCGPFQHQLVFTLPNCIHLNHSTTFSEIDIRHELKIHIELTSTTESQETLRTHIRLDTPITILDCRLKEDYTTLPTYEQALLLDSVVEDEIPDPHKQGFFICPCYRDFKKKTKCTRKEWMKFREQHDNINNSSNRPTLTHNNSSSSDFNVTPPPPSYDSLDVTR